MKKLMLLLAIASTALLSGCYTQRKAAGQMDKVYSRYENVAAGKCANWFPVRIDTVMGEKEYLPGKVDTLPGETIYINCDSIKGNPGKTDPGRVAVNCPPSTVRHDTVRQTVYITKENTAALRAEQLAHQKTEKKLAGSKTAIIILSIILALSLIGNWLLFKRK